MTVATNSDGRPLLRTVAEFVGEGMGGPPAPYTQRMVRSGDWKLCYYHQHADGQPWQVIQIADPPPRPVLREFSGQVWRIFPPI